MRLTRRRLLALMAATAVAGGGGVVLSTGFINWIQAQLASTFGTDIAARAAAAGFVDDFAGFVKGAEPYHAFRLRAYFRLNPPWVPLRTAKEARIKDQLLRQFVLSTNIVLVEETGADFSYLGLYDPYRTPCANPLAASFQ